MEVQGTTMRKTDEKEYRGLIGDIRIKSRAWRRETQEQFPFQIVMGSGRGHLGNLHSRFRYSYSYFRGYKSVTPTCDSAAELKNFW